MLRAFYIAAVVLTLIFISTTRLYYERVSSAKWDAFNHMYDSTGRDTYHSYDPYDYRYEDDTREIGFISALFFLFYLAVEILGFVKLKTKTMRVLNSIGITLTGLILVWDLLMIADPGSISFDEVWETWVFFYLIQFSFCIVGIIHAFRKKV